STAVVVLQTLRRRWLLLTIGTLVVAGLIAITAYYKLIPGAGHDEAHLPPKPEAPPDLQKSRDTFVSGMQALQRDDGADAVKHFSSFTFGSRAVEEYRLY